MTLISQNHCRASCNRDSKAIKPKPQLSSAINFERKETLSPAINVSDFALAKKLELGISGAKVGRAFTVDWLAGCRGLAAPF